MPIPSYVRELRSLIGDRLLLLPAVEAVVVDTSRDEDRVLLMRRSDTGKWSLPGGILEPGESPVSGLLRELAEETGIEGKVERLALLTAGEPVTYPNGDQVQCVLMVFRCTWLSGEPSPDHDESTETAWFGFSSLPADLPAPDLRRTMCAREAVAEPILE